VPIGDKGTMLSPPSCRPGITLAGSSRDEAHNPIGALNLADTYYSQLWGPDRPEKPPNIPVEGRRKNKET